jgi:hypothetical protein
MSLSNCNPSREKKEERFVKQEIAFIEQINCCA